MQFPSFSCLLHTAEPKALVDPSCRARSFYSRLGARFLAFFPSLLSPFDTVRRCEDVLVSDQGPRADVDVVGSLLLQNSHVPGVLACRGQVR